NGALINFNFSNCSYEQNMEGSISILAEKGTVKIGGQYLNTIDYQKIEGYTIPPLPQGKGPNDYAGGYKGSMSNHDKVIENVVDTLQGRAQVATNGANGMKVVEIIEAMYLKSEQL
ncbi:MAG: Gfo/Idh/MocA family oxidoreductase, partial [Chitinophagales bacterium]